MGRGLVGIIPKLQTGNHGYGSSLLTRSLKLKLRLRSHSPVLVELNREVGHVLEGLVGERHVHVHVALAAREGSRNLQALGFHSGQPNLVQGHKGQSEIRFIASRQQLFHILGSTNSH